MISISKASLFLIIKIVLLFVFLYGFIFSMYKMATYYNLSYQKDSLKKELKVIRDENKSLEVKILEVNKKIESLENKYLTQKELEDKIKFIFKRYSIFDYKLELIKTKRLCVDRYVLLTQLVANTKEDLKAGEGILNFIGNMKKSDKYKTIYYIDYISKEKSK